MRSACESRWKMEMAWWFGQGRGIELGLMRQMV